MCDVRFLDKYPAEKSAIYSWEQVCVLLIFFMANTMCECFLCTLFWLQKNMCALPKDLKDFYMTTDGISIQWSIEFDGENIF